MKNNSIYTLSNELVASFKQNLYLCHRSLKMLNTEATFSAIGMQHYQTLRTSIFHMNRMCNIFEYLLSEDNSTSKSKMQSFDIENLLQELTGTFLSTVSAYIKPAISLQTKLSKPTSILIDKLKFEIIILNILYCCLKNSSGANAKNVKLSVYVTETDKDVVFHIRDNNAPLNNEIIQSALFDPAITSKLSSEPSWSSMVAISLKVAQKSVLALDGKLTYTPLKKGNRFNVYLPKTRNNGGYTLNSPVPYVPSYELYTEVFADIELEHILQQIIDTFEEQESNWL